MNNSNFIFKQFGKLSQKLHRMQEGDKLHLTRPEIDLLVEYLQEDTDEEKEFKSVVLSLLDIHNFTIKKITKKGSLIHQGYAHQTHAMIGVFQIIAVHRESGKRLTCRAFI